MLLLLIVHQLYIYKNKGRDDARSAHNLPADLYSLGPTSSTGHHHPTTAAATVGSLWRGPARTDIFITCRGGARYLAIAQNSLKY
jgi:hypothetical protein